MTHDDLMGWDGGGEVQEGGDICTHMAQMVKNLPANARDPGSIHELERFSGEGNGNPLQYSCLENPHGRSWATVHGVAKSWTRLSNEHFHWASYKLK